MKNAAMSSGFHPLRDDSVGPCSSSSVTLLLVNPKPNILLGIQKDDARTHDPCPSRALL